MRYTCPNYPDAKGSEILLVFWRNQPMWYKPWTVPGERTQSTSFILEQTMLMMASAVWRGLSPMPGHSVLALIVALVTIICYLFNWTGI